MSIIYLDLHQLVCEHDRVIDQSGGLHGVKDIGAIESILFHIQNDDYYPTLEIKATHLFYGVNKSHAFNDGNKRASLIAVTHFIQLNGYGFLVGSMMRDFENIAVYIAENIVDKEFLEKLICSYLEYGEFQEHLKQELISKLMQHYL